MFSYSGNPSSTPKDRVRYLLRDTEALGALASDEEIEFELTERGTPELAAAALADGIALGFERRIGFSIDGIKIDFASRAKAMRDLATSLRGGGGGGGAGGASAPVAGALVSGISRSGMADAAADCDRLPPFLAGRPDDALDAPWSDPWAYDGGRLP